MPFHAERHFAPSCHLFADIHALSATVSISCFLSVVSYKGVFLLEGRQMDRDDLVCPTE